MSNDNQIVAAEYIRPGMALDRNMDNHGLLAQASNDEKRNYGLARLNEYVMRQRPNAERVVRSIIEETPRDRYVPVGAMLFDVDPETGAIVADIASERNRFAQHALDQAANRIGFSGKALHDMQAEGLWGSDLAAHNLNEYIKHKADPSERYLIREVNGQVRGVMSASYKRVDSRPTLDAIIGATETNGALIVSGIYTETRLSLKVIKPEPIEVFPGEWMVFGLDFSNSDYGDGANQFSAFLLRLICLNGAVSEVAFRKVHLGKRFNGDDGFSERTLQLDAMAQASAAKDTVKLLTSAEATDSLVKQIQKANDVTVSPDGVASFLKTRTAKAEQKAIVEKFTSADIVEVPAGQNAWRLSNAISWLARETTDARRKMELEVLAGEAMTAK